MSYLDLLPFELKNIIFLKSNINVLLNNNNFHINWKTFLREKIKHDFNNIDIDIIPSYMYNNINEDILIKINYDLINTTYTDTKKIIDTIKSIPLHAVFSLKYINNFKLLKLEPTLLLDLIKNKNYVESIILFGINNENKIIRTIKYRNYNNLITNKISNIINIKDLYNLIFHFHFNQENATFINV